MIAADTLAFRVLVSTSRSFGGAAIDIVEDSIVTQAKAAPGGKQKQRAFSEGILPQRAANQ